MPLNMGQFLTSVGRNLTQRGTQAGESEFQQPSTSTTACWRHLFAAAPLSSGSGSCVNSAARRPATV